MYRNKLIKTHERLLSFDKPKNKLSTMSSSDECDRSGGANTPSPKVCEFSDDNLNIDIDILISEVQSRALLWDKSLDHYSDRNLKRVAWEEICVLFYPDFNKISRQQQKQIGK